MKLGFVSAILPDLELNDVFQATAELGFDCIELMCWPRGKAQRRYAGVTHIDVDAVDSTNANDLRQQAAEFGVEISGLGYYPNALSPDKEESR